MIATRVLITAEPVSASRPNKSQRGGLWQGWYACFGTGSHHVGTAGAPTAPLDQTGPYVSDRTHRNRPALGIRWQGSLNTYSPKFSTLTSKTKTLLHFGNCFSLFACLPTSVWLSYSKIKTLQKNHHGHMIFCLEQLNPLKLGSPSCGHGCSACQLLIFSAIQHLKGPAPLLLTAAHPALWLTTLHFQFLQGQVNLKSPFLFQSLLALATACLL